MFTQREILDEVHAFMQDRSFSCSSRSYELCIRSLLPIAYWKRSKNHDISKGPSQPKDHSFPSDKRNRLFQVSWYEKFNWLEYSKSLDKATV